MAGYSGTPLFKKLGIKEGSVVRLVGEPTGFRNTLEPLPARVALQEHGPFDVQVVFVTERKVLATELGEGRRAMRSDGGLWIAWPKKSSKVATDVTEDVIRAEALPTGLVDNKVCAIDETWSGLRLVIRKALR